MFIEQRFPTNISIGMRGGPEFSTLITESITGYETRNVNWLESRNRYEIAKAISNEKELEQILTFFRLTKGKAFGFRFKDHSDFKVQKQLLFKGDGSTKSFQLYKTYQLGEDLYHRKITKPVKGTMNIQVCKSEMSFGVDYKSGLVRFIKSLPKDCEVWGSFEFDVPVRFNNDYLELTNHYQKIYSIDRLELIELKL